MTGTTATFTDYLDAAEERKYHANDVKCVALKWKCLPLAITPYGGWGRESTATLRRIANLMALRNGDSNLRTCLRMTDVLSMITAKSTARAIMSRTPQMGTL